LDPAARDFNYTWIDGREATSEAVLNEIQSLPVFSPRRLVVIKNAEAMPAAEANQLVGYLKDPCPTTCLVLVAEKVDSRRTLFQTLTKSHVTVDCRPLTENQLPSWIRHQARRLGHDITEEAVNFLVEQVGSDLYKLQNEMMKAGLIKEQHKPISRHDVQQVCGRGGQWSIPDLLQALCERRSEQAILILKNLMESGEVPLVILAAISRQFRQAYKVKQRLLANQPEAMIQKKLAIWRTSWPKILRHAKAYAMEDLRWAFKRFMETDAALKGSVLPNPVLMEMLVLDLCSGKKGSLRRFLGRERLVHLESEA
jgi:DNA polymerase III subunit delta